MLSLARRILSRWSTRIPIDSYISLQNALILDLIDWEKTKAVGAGYAKTGKIYINAKNRQETLNEITICLKDLMKNYGLSLIVKKGSDLFTDAARAPDLFVISQEKGLSIDEDFRTDLVLADRFSNPKLASDHSYEGIFLFYGPNLKKGMASRDAKIVDLVPTLLWIMDIPIPKELDGKILFNLFDHDYVVSHVQRYQTMTPDEEVTKYWRKKNEEEEIKQRLNQLGYI
jgi:predicted AlkP superfamily phosphohydrolase/phosphomutase